MSNGNIDEIVRAAIVAHIEKPEFKVMLKEMAEQSAKSAVQDVVGSRGFRETTENIYRDEIKGLILRSESKARWWAGIAAVLFFLLFTGVLSWQLAEAKQKLADLSIQQAGALDSINRFNNSVDTFKTGVNKQIEEVKGNVNSATTELAAKLTGIQSTVSQLEARTRAAAKAPTH
ncbi:MAG TPA: hypothetical protein VNH65_07960 [Candidatus Acidoferrum sp.]|nr:hypothetical protein [Candidatus Acidoferrum sp.]